MSPPKSRTAWILAGATAGLLAITVVVGFVEAEPDHVFNWELASILGTALGTTALAAATAWLAFVTRREATVTREGVEATKKLAQSTHAGVEATAKLAESTRKGVEATTKLAESTRDGVAATQTLAESTRDGVAATQALAELARRDQEMAERPSLVVQERPLFVANVDEPPSLTIKLVNIGRGPAWNVVARASWASEEPGEAFRVSIQMAVVPGVVADGEATARCKVGFESAGAPTDVAWYNARGEVTINLEYRDRNGTTQPVSDVRWGIMEML
jgi:hypothetical protein